MPLSAAARAWRAAAADTADDPMQSRDPRHPALGYGLGLRVEYYEDILEQHPAIDWLEALSENYMAPGGKPLHYLDRFRESYPIVLHGVSMSIGGSDPLDRGYLAKLRALAERIEPAWVSDHLCWTGIDGIHLHDLMPLPYTEEALGHVVARVHEVQDFLGRRIALENVSSYVAYHASRLSEAQFLAEVARRADCLILLDVNNVYVSSRNHGFDARTFLDEIPVERVQQFHLAGHENNGALIVDTHDAAIVDPVWDLYAYAVRRFGPVSTMIERDDHIPPLAELTAELDTARAIAQPILQAVA
jgi:uncharacterized protein (UPF0276 family)